MDCGREPHRNGLDDVPNGLYKFRNAISTPSSAPSSLSDGKVASTEKCLAVTLMYGRKLGDKVLFLEAGKDFVDILLSLLTLPMGSIIKLLYGDRDLSKPDGGIFNVFQSVEKMGDEKFCTSKKFLLEPRPASGFGSKLLEADSDQEIKPSPKSTGSVYFSCGMVPHCVYITKKLGWRCPRHGRKMQTLCHYVDGVRDNPEARPIVETGYVKEGSKFFVTDDLEIFPTSKALVLLQKLKVESMSMLNSVDLFVGMEEILKLLKASLTSTTVLQDVFGKVLLERWPPPVSTSASTSDAGASFVSGIISLLSGPRPKYDDYFPRPTGSLFW